VIFFSCCPDNVVSKYKSFGGFVESQAEGVVIIIGLYEL
jgi:hypothetical protein